MGSGRLRGRKALVTGGDSGIGRAAAIAFAREGADVASHDNQKFGRMNFCHPEGTFGRLGLPVQNQLDIVPKINVLRAAAHASGILVIYTALGFAPDYSDSGILLDDQAAVKEMKGLIRDTWDTEILSDFGLDPSKGEILITKTRNTSFWGTNLQSILEKHGIDQLLVTGLGTNVCVESTVREAFTLSIHTKTIRDATATLTEEEHEASLKSLRRFRGVVTSEEVIEALKQQPRRGDEKDGNRLY